MKNIHKASKFEDVVSYDKAFWWGKSPEERLEVALKLIQSAKEIYKANPKNKPLTDGTRIFKSDSPIERRKR
jgi:hypothetical protein